MALFSIGMPAVQIKDEYIKPISEGHPQSLGAHHKTRVLAFHIRIDFIWKSSPVKDTPAGSAASEVKGVMADKPVLSVPIAPLEKVIGALGVKTG
jgi:hypothetical protein